MANPYDATPEEIARGQAQRAAVGEFFRNLLPAPNQPYQQTLKPATIPPQTGTPTVPDAPSPLQTTPPAPAAPPRATVPTVGPTQANAAALGTPRLPNFLTGGVAAPGVPAPTYPTTPGPGAGGYAPVQNTPGTASPYQMYARSNSGGLDVGYTSPQGTATILGGTGNAVGNDTYTPGQNALGLTLGQRGQGALSAVGGPSIEQQAATAQNVAGIESQIAALQSLREARNPGITTGQNGLAAPEYSRGVFDRPGDSFGDAQMRENRYLSQLAEAGDRFGQKTVAQRKALIEGAQTSVLPGIEGARMNAEANQANQAARTAQTAATVAQQKIGAESASERARLAAAEQQNRIKNELDQAQYLTGLGKTSADIAKMRADAERQAQLLPGEKAKTQFQSQEAGAKALIEARKVQLVLAAAQETDPAKKQSIYEELAKLPGGNANVFNPLGMQ